MHRSVSPTEPRFPHVRQDFKTLRTSLRFVLFSVTLLVCTALATADTVDISFSSYVNWEDAEVVVTGRAALEGDYSGETARAARQILRRRDEAFRNAVVGVPVSSAETVRDILDERPGLIGELDEREPAGVASGARPTRDLRFADLTIRYPLHETITRAYRPHEIPRAVPRSLSWVPTREYTGVVIDARGQLPVHGTEEESKVEPVVLPRLYDSGMRLLLESRMVEPEYLSRWGTAAYTSDPALEGLEDRIGDDPLFTAADSVFGTRPANPMLPREAAERLLTLSENRRLLAEGRVVIVVEPEVLETDR